jgi:hypothetical protein
MAWFAPVALGIGVAGTRTALESRRHLRAGSEDHGWWLLVVLSWLPLVCWLAAQFVVQDP